MKLRHHIELVVLVCVFVASFVTQAKQPTNPPLTTGAILIYAVLIAISLDLISAVWGITHPKKP